MAVISGVGLAVGVAVGASEGLVVKVGRGAAVVGGIVAAKGGVGVLVSVAVGEGGSVGLTWGLAAEVEATGVAVRVVSGLQAVSTKLKIKLSIKADNLWRIK